MAECGCNMRTKLVGDGCEICNPEYALSIYKDTIADQDKELDTLREQLEQLRVQLAGCGVAAMCNTRQSREEQFCIQDSYGWSASYQDVVDAVGREIALREERDMLLSAIEASENDKKQYRRDAMAAEQRVRELERLLAMSENYHYADCEYCGKSLMEGEIHNCKEGYLNRIDALREELATLTLMYECEQKAAMPLRQLVTELREQIKMLEESEPCENCHLSPSDCHGLTLKQACEKLKEFNDEYVHRDLMYDLMARLSRYEVALKQIALSEVKSHYWGDHGMGGWEECTQCEALVEIAQVVLKG